MIKIIPNHSKLITKKKKKNYNYLKGFSTLVFTLVKAPIIVNFVASIGLCYFTHNTAAFQSDIHEENLEQMSHATTCS